MASIYKKNYTDTGYLMKYNQDEQYGSYKNRVLQFKIELSETNPLIWRKILVPSNYNFWDLHVALQDSMGWLDYHLHHFEIKGKGLKYPTCIDGELACPPEDCGGIDGFYELQKTLSNPDDEEYADTRTWVGDNWDAEKFNKTDIKFMNPYKRWKNAFLKD